MSRRNGRVKRQATQEMVLDPQRRVRELSEMGSSVTVNKTYPVKRYFRSGSEMERQARVYYTEGQLDKAFILYNKFVTLFLEKLPKEYPDYNKSEYKVDRNKIKKLVKEAFPRAEELKKKLLIHYEAEKAALETKLAEEAEARQKEDNERRAAEPQQTEEAERRMREEAEKRAKEEAERVAAFLATPPEVHPADQTSGTIGIEGAEGDSPWVASTVTENDTVSHDVDRLTDPDTSWTQTTETIPDADHQQQQQELISTMGTLTINEPTSTHDAKPDNERSVTATNSQLAQVLPSTYQGPPVPHSQNTAIPQQSPVPHLVPPGATSEAQFRAYQSIFSGPIAPAQTPPPNYSDLPPPPVNLYYTSTGAQIPPGTDPRMMQPYQQYWVVPGQGYQIPPHPAVPYAAQYSTASTSSWGSVELPAPSYHMTSRTTPTQTIQEQEPSPHIPTIDRSTKPIYNALSTSIGGGYRMVYVPECISHKFQEAASSNTRQNIETCAILAGKLSHNQLHITHVILPKQRGGPDSCETLSEEELFDVQDQHDLITLGWIHTHPSQTAFMSSVDLHTHCSYQIMLDEAIAIVCAPKFSQVGVYMLTEPYGLDYITHCEEEGFHTHPKEPPLYEECSHVIYSKDPVDIVDLR